MGLRFLALAQEEGPSTKAIPVKGETVWAPWVEPTAPFFSSVLDARLAGLCSPLDNLTPRGLILNLGRGAWACFDTDLLRISAIWNGKSVTPDALGPVSYQDRSKKSDEGQRRLPTPDGNVWLANGIYPGWQIGETAKLRDPREPGPVIREVGRGPIAPELGQFDGVRLTKEGLCLEYKVAGTGIKEWVSAPDRGDLVKRRFVVQPATKTMILILGRKPEAGEPEKSAEVAIKGNGALVELMAQELQVWAVKVAPHQEVLEFEAHLTSGELNPKAEAKAVAPKKEAASGLHWPEEIRVKVKKSQKKDAYVLDDIPLPLNNPWKRNVRPVDVKFFRDGTAAVVTFDGDVWRVRDITNDTGEVTWRRIASGLHEPMSLVIRNEELFVYDRHGIWQLRDTTGSGEVDEYRLFANCFGQTAETREFASSMKLAPDGAFIISKGGQQGSSLGKHNGMVLRIAPDGQSMSVLGWGFRGPFIGVHPKTGVVTVSDQEGNYVPTTPLYLLSSANEYHGYLSGLLPKEKYPTVIADPLVWIPHSVNASAVTQAWLADSKMGPLSDRLLHFGYTRPEIFEVLMTSRATKPQAAVVSLNHEIEFPPINGTVNPVDGQLYVTGFVGWGTTASRNGGLARLRYTGAPFHLPTEVSPMDRGILLRFDVALDPEKAGNLSNYSVERWNYQRSYKYGSPHVKLDGTPGQDRMPLGSVYISKDHKSVFIGVPDMKPVMQMRVGWAIESAAKVAMQENAFFTPYELTKFEPEAEGFEKIEVDLTPKLIEEKSGGKASAAEGEKLTTLYGCIACHSTDGSMVGKIGPSWKGLFGNLRKFADGTQATADEAYLHESIVDPSAKIVSGFEKSESGMPNYSGVLTEAQIQSIILYIKSLPK